MMRQRWQQWGFTLLETMLVVSLMALIAGMTLIGVRRYEKSQREQLTAKQIFGVLQAALTYQTEQQDWPAAQTDCSSSTAPTATAFINNYLPNASARAQLGGYFCWDADHTSSGSTQKFWTAVKLPGQGLAAIKVGKQILANLPAASLVQDPTASTLTPCNSGSSLCYVRAEIVRTPKIDLVNHNWFIDAYGICDPQSSATAAYSNSGIVCTHSNTASADHFVVSNIACASNQEVGILPALNQLTLGAYRTEVSCTSPDIHIKYLAGVLKNLQIQNISCQNNHDGTCQCSFDAHGTLYGWVLQNLPVGAHCTATPTPPLYLSDVDMKEGVTVESGAEGYVGANYIVYLKNGSSA